MSGTTAKFVLLMDKNAVFQNQNVHKIPIVMTATHALKMYACQNMASAETFQDVMIATNVHKTSALLLLILTLAPILQFLALKNLLSLIPTLSYFLMQTKQNGLENVTRLQDVFLVLLTHNVTIIMDVPLILANNNIV
jgi:hypothetical protein